MLSKLNMRYIRRGRSPIVEASQRTCQRPGPSWTQSHFRQHLEVLLWRFDNHPQLPEGLFHYFKKIKFLLTLTCKSCIAIAKCRLILPTVLGKLKGLWVWSVCVQQTISYDVVESRIKTKLFFFLCWLLSDSADLFSNSVSPLLIVVRRSRHLSRQPLTMSRVVFDSQQTLETARILSLLGFIISELSRASSI